MEILQETIAPLTIGGMVANNYRTADVFKKYNIDFCCKGNRQLADVCREKGLELTAIEDELASCMNMSDKKEVAFFAQMPLDELAEYIVHHHHSYVRDSIPVLSGYLEKVYKVHGRNHPELEEILSLFLGCAEELLSHMIKEETILFPAIKKLAQAQRTGTNIPAPFFFGTLANPINNMQHEHATEGDRAARITKLTSNFSAPEDACTTYKVSYQKLDEFFSNLYVHIHLENNIFFPGGLFLEQALVKVV